MEPNQTNPSQENSPIPQGIPTGVFVSNNQPSAQIPVQNTVQQPIPVVPETVQVPTQPISASVPPTSVAEPSASVVVPEQSTEGPLDRIFK